MTYDLPAAIPRVGGPVRRAIGRLGLRLLGWRIDGEFPDAPKFVLIVAPHSSNWDFVVGVFAKFALSLDVTYIGKNTLFRPPFGFFFRALGGIPVDRSKPNNLVAESAHAFATRRQMILVIAPEGTRKRVTQWKTGFYHIARAADVPVLPVVFDWGRKVIDILTLVDAGDDVEAGVAGIQELYRSARGRRGESAI